MAIRIQYLDLCRYSLLAISAGKEPGGTKLLGSQTPRDSRRHLWHQWQLKLAIITLFIASGCWYIASPRGAAHLAQGVIEAITGAEVEIHAAQFGIDGKIELNHLVIRLPRSSDKAGLLFEAEHVYIEHNLWSLLIGTFEPSVFNITRPVIWLTEDLETGKFNYQLLQEYSASRPPKKPPLTLPEIQLDNGRIHFSEARGARFTRLNETAFEGNLSAASGKEAMYNFVIRQVSPKGIPGATVNGSFNPRDQRFTAQVDQFALESPQRNWLPSRWRQWWDEHEQGPTGTMQKLRIGYDLESNQFYAQITFDDVVLIPPYTPFRKAGLPMIGGSGTFTFHNDRIVIDNLRGTIEDIEYRINGTISGFDADAPLELTVVAPKFTLTKDTRYLMVLPESIAQQFRKYNPDGEFSSQVLFIRDKHGGQLRYQGAIDFHNVAAVYNRFPYPLQSIHGQIHFDQDQIELVSLSGRGPTGAKVLLSGKIWPPQPYAASDLTITATRVPIDHHLHQAMSRQKHRDILDLFFNVPAHRELVADGIIHTSGQKNAASNHSTGRPVFDPGGMVDLVSHITSPGGKGVKPTVETIVRAKGVHVLHKHWPYPLRITDGNLVIGSKQTRINQIHAQGLSNQKSQFIADGIIAYDKGRTVPDVKITATDVVLDDFLIASIPKPQRQWIYQLGISGVLDAQSHVHATDNGLIDFEITSLLRNGQSQPSNSPFQINLTNVKSIISRRNIQIKQLDGNFGHATISGTAAADWDGDKPMLAIDLEAKRLRFEDPIIDLLPADQLPQSLVTAIKQCNPTGTYNAQLHATQHLTGLIDYQIKLQPHELEVDWAGHRIALNNMAGDVIFTPDGADLKSLSANYNAGKFTTSGHIALGDQLAVDLVVSAKSSGLGSLERAVVPHDIEHIIDQLQLKSAYEIESADITYHPKAVSGSRLAFRGRTRLINASAQVGAPMTDLNGLLDVDVTYLADQQWPDVKMRLKADHLRIHNRQISPLSLSISNGHHPREMMIENILGHCYGGMVFGSGRLGQDGYFLLYGVMQDVALEPFLNPVNQMASGGDRSTGGTTHGLISSNMAIEGYYGDKQTRKGRGQVIVRQANLYNLPLSLTLMQLLNLTFPSAQSFNAASAGYLIDGDMVLFDDITLEAPSIRIAGTGKMQYSTRELDLDMSTSNPTGWDFGPLSDLVALFKNELISIDIRGTLGEPQAKMTSLRGATRSLQSIFGPGHDSMPNASINKEPLPADLFLNNKKVSVTE